MKVLHISNYYPGVHHHAGGAEHLCRRIVEHSRMAGVEASALTLPPDIRENAREILPCRTLESLAGPLDAKILQPLKWYLFQNDPLARWTLKRLLQKDRPDLVHFHNFQFLTLSLLKTVTRFGIPSCLSVYDYWYFCPATTLTMAGEECCRHFHGPHCTACLPSFLSGFQRILLSRRKKAFDRYLECVNIFFVLSRASQRVLLDYGIESSRIVVLPPLYDRPDLPKRPKEVNEGPHILFVGWLQERKGLHVLLRAFPEILRAFPAAVLTVIGGKVRFGRAYERKIEQLIRALGLRPHLRILGSQPQKGVYRELVRSHLVAIPEQWENMSPVILVEALFAGKPVVASRLGGIPEMVEEGLTGYTFSPGDPKDLAEKACRILADDTLQKKAAQRGPSMAGSLFLPESNMPLLLECYEALAKGKALEGAGRDRIAQKPRREPCAIGGGSR